MSLERKLKAKLILKSRSKSSVFGLTSKHRQDRRTRSSSDWWGPQECCFVMIIVKNSLLNAHLTSLNLSFFMKLIKCVCELTFCPETAESTIFSQLNVVSISMRPTPKTLKTKSPILLSLTSILRKLQTSFRFHLSRRSCSWTSNRRSLPTSTKCTYMLMIFKILSPSMRLKSPHCFRTNK